MTTQAGAAVVVGVDGSDRALHATRLAAAEAVLHHRPLRIVHAMHWPRLSGGGRDVPPDSLTSQANVWLSAAVAAARKAAPGVAASAELLVGHPSVALRAAADTAYLLVLGDHGLGGFTGLSGGSMAVQTAGHCPCPVLVARGADRSGGPVVVGLDGSAASARTLECAAEEASLRTAELVVLHATARPAPPATTPHTPRQEQERALAEGVAGVAERFPDLPVRRELVTGSPAKALIDWSYRAQLMVVGCHGRAGLAGFLLGTVSRDLIHRAACPVLVAPTAARAERPGVAPA